MGKFFGTLHTALNLIQAYIYLMQIAYILSLYPQSERWYQKLMLKTLQI